MLPPQWLGTSAGTWLDCTRYLKGHPFKFLVCIAQNSYHLGDFTSRGKAKKANKNLRSLRTLESPPVCQMHSTQLVQRLFDENLGQQHAKKNGISQTSQHKRYIK